MGKRLIELTGGRTLVTINRDPPLLQFVVMLTLPTENAVECVLLEDYGKNAPLERDKFRLCGTAGPLARPRQGRSGQARTPLKNETEVEDGQKRVYSNSGVARGKDKNSEKSGQGKPLPQRLCPDGGAGEGGRCAGRHR